MAGFRRWPTIAAALAAGTILACASPEPLAELGAGARARFIGEDPRELIDLASLYAFEPVGDWKLAHRAEADRWTAEADRRGFEEVAGGLLSNGVGGPLVLAREVALEASEIHTVEVAAADFGRGFLRLSWQRAEESGEVPEERALRLRAEDGRGPGGELYRFEVAGQRAWRGTITRLALAVAPAPGERPVVLSVRALTRRPRAADWERAAERAWKVDLGNEVRNSFLAPPGSILERRATVPEGGELRLAFGGETSLRRPVTFRVRVVAGGSAETLFEQRLDPAASDFGRWHEARLALDPWAGRRVVLRLETSSGDPPAEAASGLSFWAHPEVVRRSPGGRPLQVLLIVIDTLRADHLSLYGYPRPTSPHLDAWARRSAAVFRSVVAAAPWTLPSHYSIFTGENAFHHGFNHDMGRVERDSGGARGAPLLAEILRRAGYATGAFTGGAYLHPKYGFARGFERYGYWPDRARAERELSTGVDRALGWLQENRGESSFFFLHTYAVHDPYRARQPFFDRLAPPGVEALPGEIALESPPNEPALGFQQVNRFVWRHRGQKRRLGEDDRPLIEAFYDSGIARMDRELQRLLAGLEKRGLADSTVVVLTSDHGEGLGEGGVAGHVDLYDRNLLVPLVIALPDGWGAGRTIDDQVRSIDILPTLLDLLGLDPPGEGDGVSLVDLIAGERSAVPDEAWSYSAAANRGVSLRQGNRLKYIRNDTPWAPVAGREELYDLPRDPLESRNRAAGDPQLAALRQRTVEKLEADTPGLRLRVRNAGPGTLSGEIRGPMVRSLGLKSPDLACRCVIWKDVGRAELAVPPGEGFTLRFGKLFGDRLELDGALVDGGRRIPFRETFAVGSLGSAAGLHLADGRWLPGPGPAAEDVTGFEIWWQGDRVEHRESPAAADPEIRRQLKALGYQ